jgi:hypothetical protein
MPINGFTCVPDLRGNWNPVTKTCYLGDPTLPAGTDLIVEPGVTAVIPKNVSIEIGADRTLLVDSGGTLRLDGGNLRISDGTIDNDGTLSITRLSSGGPVMGILGRGNIDNSGTLIVNYNSDAKASPLHGSLQGSIVRTDVSRWGIYLYGSISNSGAIIVQKADAGDGIRIQEGTLTNTGTISLQNSIDGLVISSSARMNNYGTIDVNKNSNYGIATDSLINNYGTINVNDGGTIANGGTIVVYCGASLNLNGGTVTNHYIGVVIYNSPCYIPPTTNTPVQPTSSKSLVNLSSSASR